MKRLISKSKKLKNKTFISDILGFADLIISEFAEHLDCIIFKKDIFSKNVIGDYIDNTNLEAFFNHIHMSDYLYDDRGVSLLKLGLIFCEILSLKLKNEFPNYKFRIIISYDEKNELGYNDCVVRFHKLRKGENYLLKNLEEYKSDAIGYIDI
ncbi:MAG: hypothetical protein ISS16_09540 [Ignavibacteria bacterium]|nr:hypothetical protein [Ignavibacteria bacterium]